MLKNIITSIVIGVIAFLAVGFIQLETIPLPTDLPSIAQLFIIIGAVFCGTLFTGGQAPVGQTSNLENETGTVKWFNVKKGYGFITRDQGDDVFVHYRNIEGDGRRSINEGQRVSFVVVPGDKGLQADQVSAI